MAGPPTRKQERMSARLPTENQAGLVATLWCWDAEPLRSWKVQSLGHWAEEDVRSHVALCGLHGTP